MKKILLAAALAFAPIPAHANYIEIVNGEVTLGIGFPHLTPGTFDLADPDWSFENDPNWRTEIVPCALVPWILGEYISWETAYQPPAPPIDPPPPCADCDPPPPCVMCGPPPVVAVPELTTWAMMLAGLSALGLLKWRRA